MTTKANQDRETARQALRVAVADIGKASVRRDPVGIIDKFHAFDRALNAYDEAFLDLVEAEFMAQIKERKEDG